MGGSEFSFRTNSVLIVLTGHLANTDEWWVHIDTFSAMNGISRFCESDSRWR